MPIEIKELVIKAVVQDVAPNAEASETNMPMPHENRLNEMVAACVEQVLHIIKEKQER